MRIINEGWKQDFGYMGICPSCGSTNIQLGMKPESEENPIWGGNCLDCLCFYTSEDPELTFISGIKRAVDKTTSGDAVPDKRTGAEASETGGMSSKGE